MSIVTALALLVAAFFGYTTFALMLVNGTLEREHLQAQAQNYRHQRTISEMTRSIGKFIRELDIAKSTLINLRDQNFGQPTYEVWARKRAQDALNYINGIALYGNPLGKEERSKHTL